MVTPIALPDIGGGPAEALAAIPQASPAVPKPPEKPLWPRETGTATLYAADMEGRLTASGEPYDPDQLTAAHRELPLGTRVRVTNLKNNKSILVHINDRWGGGGDRVVNLSNRAAVEIGFGSAGMVPVTLEVESFAPDGVMPRVAPTRMKARPLPVRLANDGSGKHSKRRLCENEADILGLRDQYQRNHVATCMARK